MLWIHFLNAGDGWVVCHLPFASRQRVSLLLRMLVHAPSRANYGTKD